MANSGVKSLSSDRFYFLGLQNHYGQLSCLLLGRKAMTNLDRGLKSRVFTLPTKVCIIKAIVFPAGCMDMRFGPWRRLSSEELMLSNCGAGEDSSESLGLQGDQTSQSKRKLILNIHWKDWWWSWNSNTKELTHWKVSRCWERLRASGEGGDRRWDGWMHHWLNGHKFEKRVFFVLWSTIRGLDKVITVSK